MKETPILFSGEMVRAILSGRKTQTRRVAKFKPLHEGLNFGWSGLEAGHYCIDAPQHGWVLRARRGDGCWEDKTRRLRCPYGVVGDRLWVRERWRIIGWDPENGDWKIEYADGTVIEYTSVETLSADMEGRFWMQCSDDCLNAGVPVDDDGNFLFDTLLPRPTRWRPSIFMPREFSRILLEITGIRAERVQSISEEDAIAEGFAAHEYYFWAGFDKETGAFVQSCCEPGSNPPDYMTSPRLQCHKETARSGFLHTWDKINAKRGYPWAGSPWVWVIEFRKVNHD